MNKMGKMAMNMKTSMGKQYRSYGAGKGQWQQDRYQPYHPYNPEWTTPVWQKQESDKGGGKDKGKGKGKGKKSKKGNGKKGGW